jgi:hypothetical protein
LCCSPTKERTFHLGLKLVEVDTSMVHSINYKFLYTATSLPILSTIHCIVRKPALPARRL